MAIGIFGGSFNPTHLGHLVLAREVQHRCRIEDFIFMPSGAPPHKKILDLVSAEHRLAMVNLAIEPALIHLCRRLNTSHPATLRNIFVASKAYHDAKDKQGQEHTVDCHEPR